MCETSFYYYAVARHDGRPEFNIGNVLASDEDEARTFLIKRYKEYFPGPAPHILDISLGLIQAVNGEYRGRNAKEEALR